MKFAIYYNCSHCGSKVDLQTPEEKFNKKCSECGEDIRSYTIRQVDSVSQTTSKNTCHVDALMKENKRWSWSMGVNTSQIPEMMKKYPGSEYHPKTGQLLIKNRVHKLREMKRRGYAEYN